MLLAARLCADSLEELKRSHRSQAAAKGRGQKGKGRRGRKIRREEKGRGKEK